MEIKVAISQKPPVMLNLKASIKTTINNIVEAANNGAKFIMFPESHLPGFPFWVQRIRPKSDEQLGNDIHQILVQNSVDVKAGGLNEICKTAEKHNIVIAIGFHEIDNTYSGSTLYNSLAIIDSDGTLLNVHRKLIPTNQERMVWGMGDGSGLYVVQTSIGRIGGLICWENHMPLARFALYSQSIDIYVAPTWDDGDGWISTIDHIAHEGGCWVFAASSAIKGSDIPANFPCRSELIDDEEWINSGGAVIAKPGGGILAGPMRKERAILYATIDPQAAQTSRKFLDVSGHYSRPDIFNLTVNRKPQPPIDFQDK